MYDSGDFSGSGSGICSELNLGAEHKPCWVLELILRQIPVEVHFHSH